MLRWKASIKYSVSNMLTQLCAELRIKRNSKAFCVVFWKFQRFLWELPHRCLLTRFRESWLQFSQLKTENCLHKKFSTGNASFFRFNLIIREINYNVIFKFIRTNSFVPPVCLRTFSRGSTNYTILKEIPSQQCLNHLKNFAAMWKCLTQNKKCRQSANSKVSNGFPMKTLSTDFSVLAS